MMNLYVATGPIFICKEQQSSRGLFPISKDVFHHALNKLEFSRPPGALDRFPAWLLVEVGRRTWLLLLLPICKSCSCKEVTLVMGAACSQLTWVGQSLGYTNLVSGWGKVNLINQPTDTLTKFGRNGCSWCISQAPTLCSQQSLPDCHDQKKYQCKKCNNFHMSQCWAYPDPRP